MFEEFSKLFQIDWRIFMAGTETWLQGGDPYGQLSAEFSAGAFGYPPTALTWLALFAPLGALGFYVWTALQLAGWWLIIRRDNLGQLTLLCWSPMILHLVEGQSTLPVILAIWAAYRAERRSWMWGLALAWAMTKPQVALLPLLWLLWQDRTSPFRWGLWGGLVLGTLLLALPPTLLNPMIWFDWIGSLGAYRERILQMAAWQGASVVLLGLAAYLWLRSGRGGWQWWLAAGVFPHTSFYSIVAVLPALHVRQSNWTLAGIALAGLLMGPVNEWTLPWILAGHMLAVWMIGGGCRGERVKG
jgi:hypothetical protein